VWDETSVHISAREACCIENNTTICLYQCGYKYALVELRTFCFGVWNYIASRTVKIEVPYFAYRCCRIIPCSIKLYSLIVPTTDFNYIMGHKIGRLWQKIFLIMTEQNRGGYLEDFWAILTWQGKPPILPPTGDLATNQPVHYVLLRLLVSGFSQLSFGFAPSVHTLDFWWRNWEWYKIYSSP
jgi:hypothetical protein